MNAGLEWDVAPLEMTDSQNNAEIRKLLKFQKQAGYTKRYTKQERDLVRAMIRVHRESIQHRAFRK